MIVLLGLAFGFDVGFEVKPIMGPIDSKEAMEYLQRGYIAQTPGMGTATAGSHMMRPTAEAMIHDGVTLYVADIHITGSADLPNTQDHGSQTIPSEPQDQSDETLSSATAYLPVGQISFKRHKC